MVYFHLTEIYENCLILSIWTIILIERRRISLILIDNQSKIVFCYYKRDFDIKKILLRLFNFFIIRLNLFLVTNKLFLLMKNNINENIKEKNKMEFYSTML